jgi:hypothetical protein
MQQAYLPARRSRRIFVAYPYALPKADYRKPFIALGKAFEVEFHFADQRITNKQILLKITEMIATSRFSLFDITRWNANVALELGIAIGQGQDYYLLFNPDDPKNPSPGEVPADLGGFDRIEYSSYSELEEGLTRLLVQEFGANPPSKIERDDPVSAYRDRIPDILGEEPGLKIGEIADRLSIVTEVAKLVVRPMVEARTLETRGAKRGTTYYLAGRAPKFRLSRA